MILSLSLMALLALLIFILAARRLENKLIATLILLLILAIVFQSSLIGHLEAGLSIRDILAANLVFYIFVAFSEEAIRSYGIKESKGLWLSVTLIIASLELLLYCIIPILQISNIVLSGDFEYKDNITLYLFFRSLAVLAHVGFGWIIFKFWQKNKLPIGFILAVLTHLTYNMAINTIIS